jgi:aminoglycoside phosphotransferase (APT) family kinase protein
MGNSTPQGGDAPDGIDAARVTSWFTENVPAAEPGLHFELVAGGRSNLTFVVTDGAGTRYVLRRPPTGHLLPTAHDMTREYRILSAMEPAGVPVPPVFGLCEDPSINGAPFYVMGFVDGVIGRTELDVAAHFDEAARHRASLALVDTLAAIHLRDPDRIGLGDLGRKEGYVARQLKRWYTNYQAAYRSRGGDPLPLIDDLHARLSAAVPEQASAAVVHGDYRLDNCVLAADGSRVEAVLDWELCTLGDPLADVGQLLMYWPEPGEALTLGPGPTAMPGFARRDELVARYSERTERDLPQLGFYVAFAYWKLACILEGVYARYAGGAMGDDGFDFSLYPATIRALADRSDVLAGELQI